MAEKLIHSKHLSLNLSFEGKKELSESFFERLLLSLEILEKDLLYSTFKFLERGVSRVEISLTISNEEVIQALNRDYRNKDSVTDVISFQMHENLRDTNDDLLLSELNIGDIFICEEVALKQSIEFKISYEQELVQLFIHGVLHLLGIDHEISEEEEKYMFDLEDEIVGKIYKG